jgi:hypothetical protein
MNIRGIQKFLYKYKWTLLCIIITIFIIFTFIYEYIYIKNNDFLGIIQTIVLISTNLIMILQFTEERNAKKELMNQNVTDYCDDLQKLIFEYPQLFKVVNQQYALNEKSKTDHLSDDEALIYMYLALHYANIEKAYDLYASGDFSRNQWQSWENFLKELSKIDTFKKMHENAKGLYPSDYWNYIEENIIKDTSKVKDTIKNTSKEEDSPKIMVSQSQKK